MLAVQVHEFGDPDVLRLERVQDPVPGPGQVLVAVRAAGVNPVETYVRGGLGIHPPLPYTPGSDAAGVVVAAGAGVADVAPGDRVYTHGSLSGTYAELALCDAQQVSPLPEPLDFAAGAAIGVPYATAHHALFARGRARRGETVLIHGAAGGVGIAAVQLAAAAGLRVIGTASTAEGRRLVLSEGASHALDHASPEHGEELLELTGGGVDLIVEMRSDVNLGGDLRLLAPRGRVLCVGNRGPQNQGEVSVNARELMRREGDILGVMLTESDPAQLAVLHAELAAGFRSRALRPAVSRSYPLAEAAAAHRDIAGGHTIGKLVLVP